MPKVQELISLAPYFFDESGHYLSYHSCLQQAFQKLGYSTHTLIPYNCRVKNLDHRWVRHFHHSHNRVFRSFLRLFDYSRLLRMSKTKNAILFLESYAILDLIALCVASLLFSNRRIHLWHLFRDSLSWRPWKQTIHIALSRILRWKFGRRYLPLTDSTIIAEELEPRLNQQIFVLPIPHTDAEVQNPNNSTPAKIWRFWLPGKARKDKGLDEIKKFCEKPTSLNAELHIEKHPLFEQIASKMTIVWTAPHLSREDYVKKMGLIDALLLPYDPVIYSSRTSGPFVEAISMGKFVFTKPGSWLAKELEKFSLDLCILDWNKCELSELVKIMELDETRSKLKKMGDYYRNFHNVNSFSKAIKDLATMFS